jgi:hypothetical protein
MEHRDLTYGEVLAVLPSETLEAARLLISTVTQIKHPFYPFKCVLAPVRREDSNENGNGI